MIHELEYQHIDNLEEVITKAKSATSDSYALNLSLSFELEATDLNRPHLVDVVEDARLFQQYTRPKHLHMNHGEYITKDGIPHVISQLNKRASNRAIISLIDQDDIIGSGDKAIPSFMVLQFALEGNVLYLTTYFKALEVSKFLRINLEEIRLILCQILDKIHCIEKVRIHVLAFRAYTNSKISTLSKNKIDIIEQSELMASMIKDPSEVIGMLEELKKSPTIVDLTGLENIRIIVSNEKTKSMVHEVFRQPLFLNKLNKAIELLSRLKTQREKSSHSDRIEQTVEDIATAIDTMIEELGD